MAMIEAEGLVYDYSAQRALHGVSFQVEAGEVLALVGPNGAGKSTLMRLLAALDRPFAGAVRIAGMDAARQPRAVHARIGYLPDFFGLYDDLLVFQCLVYAARARGLAPDAAKAAAMATAVRVGLSEKVQSPAGALSRGQRQRLAIGQTIVHKPTALLLDEPAAGLDPEARTSLSDLILQLAGEGMAVIVSSHILAELEEYCSAMLVLREGRLVGGGPLRAGGIGGGRARLRVRLAAPNPRLAEMLSAQPGVRVEAVEADAALFEAPQEPQAWAALNAALVGAGFAVATLGEERQTLEQVYRSAAQAGGQS